MRTQSGPGKALFTLAILLLPLTAAAQSTVSDPRIAEFSPSPDHAAVGSNGQPVVSRYDLQFFYQGAAQPFQTADLGKPTPEADGKIRVNLSTVFTPLPLPGFTYEARVAAVGPTGSGTSDVSNPFIFTTQCASTISPTSRSVGAAAATGTVSVSATTGCPWAAASEASWITVTAGASGSGNGSVSYSVAANPTTSVRTGTLAIAGQAFTVTQAAGTCSYTLSPTSAAVTSPATTGSVSVTAGAGCNWTATSGVSWITITSGASGTGGGTVRYSVTANSTTSSRSGTLTIAGRSFTVTQAGAACTFQASPMSQTVPSAGGTAQITVSAPSGCTWSAVPDVAWLTVSAGSSGSGNGSVTVQVASNPGSATRTGTITIAGQRPAISQSGAPAPSIPTALRIVR